MPLYEYWFEVLCSYKFWKWALNFAPVSASFHYGELWRWTDIPVSNDLFWWKIECVTTNFCLHKSGGVCVCRPSSSIIFVIAWLSEGLIIRCNKNILITVLQPWKYEPVCTKEAQLIVQNTTFEGADIMSQSLTVSPYNINTRSRGHNTYAICIYISKQLLIVHVNMRPLYVLSWSAWSATRCWRAQWRYHSSHWKRHRTRVTRLVWYTWDMVRSNDEMHSPESTKLIYKFY